jgi:methanethiol S-methyltransferase
MVKEHIILALLWVVYGVLHSVLAHTVVKGWFSRHMGQSFVHYRLFYSLFALITFIAILAYQLQIASPLLYSGFLAIKVLGTLLTLLGLSLMLFCIRKYFMSLSGLRSLVRPEYDKAELMITDIHRYVRHPLYLGTFNFIWGLWLTLPYLTLLISNAIITIYTLIGIGLEEKKLELQFGDRYKFYKKRVPKILPFRKVVP